MADETFYRDQILCTCSTLTFLPTTFSADSLSSTANAAVLFSDTFRIVLRAKKNEGRQTYEAVLVDGSSHRILLAGGPGLHSIQEALFNLLIATSNQMTDYLQGLSDKEAARREHHESTSGHHGTAGNPASTSTGGGAVR
ncbi:unnamed protein product [Aureobasidium vineae]|uniref:Uncharacterized protein n=1 Tax=Aureobasidium vineae TaxID=2773715 RepID=A0A9N8JRT2_9PEZI|nr:unnamed protein product [Aureobasidium vineae]